MYNSSTLCGAKTLATPWTPCTVTAYCGVCRTSGYGDPTRAWVDSNRAKRVSTFALCIWMPAIPHLRCSPSRSSFFSRRKKVIRSFSVFVCTGWRVWKSITTSMKSCIAELAVEIPDFPRFVVRSISSIDWLMHCLGWLIDWLFIHTLIGWFFRLVDRLIDWLIDCLLACFHHFYGYFAGIAPVCSRNRPVWRSERSESSEISPRTELRGIREWCSGKWRLACSAVC